MGDRRDELSSWLSEADAAAWFKKPGVVSFAGNVIAGIQVVSAIYGMWAAREQAELLRDIKRGFNQKIDAAVIELKEYIHAEIHNQALNQIVTDSMTDAFTAISLLGNIATRPRDLQVSLFAEAAGHIEDAYNRINTIQNKKERAYLGPQILFCALTRLGLRIVESILFVSNILNQELSFQRELDDVLNVSREMIRITPEAVKERFTGPIIDFSIEFLESAVIWSVYYTMDGVKKEVPGHSPFWCYDGHLSDDELSRKLTSMEEATAAEKDSILNNLLQEAEKRLGGYEDAIRDCTLLSLGTKIDTAYQCLDGKQRFFCRGQYLDYDADRSKAIGRLERIDQKFKGVIGIVDAAFQVLMGRDKGKIYIFQGNQHYKYSEDYILEEGYPQPILERWHDLYDGASIDTVFQDATTGKIYFFKGESFIVYRADDLEKLSAGYPKKIKNHWTGIWTNHIDAIVNQNGKLYIFQDECYVRCNLTTRTAETVFKKTGKYWPELNFINPQNFLLTQPRFPRRPALGLLSLDEPSSSSELMPSSSNASSSPSSSTSTCPDGMFHRRTEVITATDSTPIVEVGSSSDSGASRVTDRPAASFSSDIGLLSSAPSTTLFTAEPEIPARGPENSCNLDM